MSLSPASLSPDLAERIQKTINQSRVMLFMKGSPSMPQCGFSATVVQLLKQAGATFGSYNILADNDLREGLKQLSNWPTYPQLYVDGKLVGGCDIVREMAARGELASVVAEPKPAS